MDRMVIFDLETGGLEETAPDIQLAAIAVKNHEIIDTFEVKIKFDLEKAELEALQGNCYDKEIWEKEAIEERVAVKKFGRFLRPHANLEKVSKKNRKYRVARLSGHNSVKFDSVRLLNMFKRHDEFLAAEIYATLDTWQMALWYFYFRPQLPKPESYRLTSLCEYFGIEVENAHDALADCRLTFELMKAMMGKR